MSSSEAAELEDYALAIEALNKRWKPHAKQVPVGQAIFLYGVKRLMLAMGRRLGKSTVIANIVTRIALAKPYSQCIILLPTIKSARKIYWLSGILKQMVPPEYVAKYNETEMIVHLTNNSYIQCTGADDPDSTRGTGIAVYAVDEAKDHKPNILNVITPGLIDNNGVLIVGGTPPGEGGDDHHFWKWVETAKTDPDWRYFHATSYDNPHLNKDLIDKERRQHEERGEIDVFTREYLALPAKSIKKSVYGMFDKATHVIPYEVVRAKVLSRIHHWTLVVALDPGSASVFAALIGAVNNHTGEVALLDEVYATKVVETSIGMVWPKIKAKMDEITDDPDLWFVVYDEAAKWAQVELQDVFDVNAFPTQKALNRKSFGVSLYKDLYLRKKIYVSDRCVNFVSETENYQTNDKGEYIKERDHLLDCSRYLVHAAHFSVRESMPPADPTPIPVDEQRRAYTIEEDMANLYGDNEGTYLLDQELDY